MCVCVCLHVMYMCESICAFFCALGIEEGGGGHKNKRVISFSDPDSLFQREVAHYKSTHSQASDEDVAS